MSANAKGVILFTMSDQQQKKSGSKMEAWDGVIFAYWEQGMEGRIEFAFQPANSSKPIFLKNGHHLTIYSKNDEVVWSGYINLVKRRFWDRHRLPVPIWSYNKQKTVPYKQWMEWFWSKPPLKAKLEQKVNDER